MSFYGGKIYCGVNVRFNLKCLNLQNLSIKLLK